MKREDKDRLVNILEMLNKTNEAEEQFVLGYAEGLLAAQKREEKNKKKGVWK